MCNCGCNTCETKGPLLTEGKVKSLLSEGLQYHIDKKIPLFETVYRIGSDKHLSLIREARKMYSRNVIDLCEEDEALIKTNLGEFALYEGVSIPLDLPMLNESYDYDEVAQSEFGMDYDQLGSGEKEWVRDEIDNMSMNEAKMSKEKIERLIYSLENQKDSWHPSSDSKKKAMLDKLKKDLSRLNEIDNMSMNESDSNYPDFDLNKNIRYQDTSISSGMWRYTGKEQGGKGVYRNLNNGQILGFDRSDFDIFRKNLSSHFNFSESINENEDKLLKIKQELEALRPGTLSWIDDIFISSYDGSLQVELDYTLYPDEIKQLAQIAAKYGMELKYMTGKNATLVKNKINEDRKYNQEELLRLDLIARRRFDCDYKNCTDEQKAEVLKDKVKVGVKEALQEAKKEIDEAEFKGKKVALGKPKRGGPKAYYVYVKDGDKVKKVTFGSGGLRAKIKNKEARNAFAARHNCKDKKDRTKAGYWSCNLPRYAPALGLGAKMNTFW
ncbi:hypothetical protein N9H34_00765 [bacterium]|nr:hypothetical protein [bacterium]